MHPLHLHPLASSASSAEETTGPASSSDLPNSDSDSDSDGLLDGSSESDPLELESEVAAPLIAIWYTTQIPPGSARLVPRNFKVG